LGYPHASLPGRRYLDLMPESEPMPPAIRGADQGAAIEQRLQRADGTLVPVEIATSPAVYQGKDGCVQALVRDVSERLAAIQSEKLRALGQMPGGVAHDFNNSPPVILGTLSRARSMMPMECGAEHRTSQHRLQMAEQAANDAAATVRRLQ